MGRGEDLCFSLCYYQSHCLLLAVSYDRESCTTLSCLWWFLSLQGVAGVSVCPTPESTSMLKAWGDYLHVTSPGDGEGTFLMAPGSRAGLLAA